MSINRIYSLLLSVLILCLSFTAQARGEATQSKDSASFLPLAQSIVKSDAQLNAERQSLFKLKLQEQEALLEKSEARLMAAETRQQTLISNLTGMSLLWRSSNKNWHSAPVRLGKYSGWRVSMHRS